MKPILTKRQNYEQWDSIEAWMASGYDEPVAMRVALEVGGGPKAFHVPACEVEARARAWMLGAWVNGNEGVCFPRECIRLAEMANGRRILQGQYANDFTGEFLHTFETGPMPEALAKSHAYTFGLRSKLLLQAHMTPSSYADLEVLLEQYPDHVFELSVWASCLGDTPGRNAIIWEVRKY